MQPKIMSVEISFCCARLTADSGRCGIRNPRSATALCRKFLPRGIAPPSDPTPDKSVSSSAGFDAINNGLDLQAGPAGGSVELGTAGKCNSNVTK